MLPNEIVATVDGRTYRFAVNDETDAVEMHVLESKGGGLWEEWEKEASVIVTGEVVR
jgi:hypothetical protein